MQSSEPSFPYFPIGEGQYSEAEGEDVSRVFRGGQFDRSVDGVRVQLATESGQSKTESEDTVQCNEAAECVEGPTRRPHGRTAWEDGRHIVTSPERTSDVGYVTSRSHPKSPDSPDT